MMRRPFTSLAAVAAMVLVLAPSALAEGLEDPIPEPIELGAPQVHLEPIASGMYAPNWATSAPGQPNHLYVTDQVGILWRIDLVRHRKTVFLDVRNLLIELGAFGPGTFDERGLLGVAFHPGYASNGLLYTYTSQPATETPDFSTLPEGAEPDHQSVVTEWRVPRPGALSSRPGSPREVLRVDQPQFNHNAGALNFGPDGMLYIALGDGGAADDQGVGHSLQGNGQDPSNILGTILRIDPLGTNSANGRYGIPADNPFVGDDGVVDEIFAYGFRNPFRFSFDADTGHLWAADVGQNDIEEVDVVHAGGNYGWRLKEGSFCFDDNGDADGFVTVCQPGDVPDDLVDPVAEYDHDEGIAVIGGFVYRGAEVPPLAGSYVFGDYSCPCTADYGRVFFLDVDGDVREMRFDDRRLLKLWLLGFGQDAHGELYVLGNHTGIPFGTTGEVLRITSARSSATSSLASALPQVM